MPQRAVHPANSPLMRIVAKWVKPTSTPENPQTLLNSDLPIIYVLKTGGIEDFTALASVCDTHQLPHPRSELVYGELRLRRRTLTLQRTPPFGIGKAHQSIPKTLRNLVDAAMAGDGPVAECQIVPVSVFWGRAPDREDSLWRQMFSETWEIAGRTNKLFSTIIYGRQTLVSFSEPLSLVQFAQSSAGIGAERAQRKLSRILRVHFRQRRIATIGPDLSHRRMLINHVLADEGVRSAINQQAKTTSNSTTTVKKRAQHYAHEIAADVSYRTVSVLQKVLTQLWTHLYDGVEFTGVDRLKAVADGREIVYVPCHRSHIDYLLLSYILYMNSLSLPHIAAGINLNMPIVGGILRRGGAFFLRRTFSGDPLYAATFNAYLKELLERGHALEYFIEGGRSRTGRLLPPKGGMLAMTVHAYLQNPQRQVVFVPVYFGYERLIEGRSFTSELAGGKKRKETIFGLLKSLKTLRENYGRVHVNIGQPINLDALLVRRKSDWRQQPISETRPDWIKPVIDELGEDIMQRINEAASVTPVSLVATAVLATPKASLGRHDLQTLVQTYHGLISGTHAHSEVIMPTMSVDAMIEHTRSLGYLNVDTDKLGELISIKPGQVAPITYFCNNIQHLLALPSLIACSFSNRASLTDQRVYELIKPAYHFLQAELFLPDQPDDAAINQALHVMQDEGLLTHEDGCWRRATAGSNSAVTLMTLAQSMMPAIERYYLNSAVLASAGSTGMPFHQFAEHCEAVAARLARTHSRDYHDWFDKHVLTRFVITMEKTNRIHREANDVLVLSPAVLNSEADARLLLDERTRHAILGAVHSFGNQVPIAVKSDKNHKTMR